MNRSTDLKNELALLFTVVVWGVNFAVVKAALGVMPPHSLNLFRFLISTLVLGTLYHRQQRKNDSGFFAPLRVHFWELFTLGLLGFLFYQFCFIVGVNNTTAGSAALIMASAPIWTAVIGHFFGFDKLTMGARLGLFVTFIGAGIIVVGGSERFDFSNETFLGNMLMVGAAFLWGAYTAFSKPASRHSTPVSISFLGLLLSLPFLIILGAKEMNLVRWEDVTFWIWAAIIFSGGLSTGLAVALWNTAVKYVGPSQTAVYGNLVPLIALVSGIVLLGETVTIAQITGGTLVLIGLVLMRRSRKPTKLIAE